ncbi:cysteine proteinase [Lichtheimia hyalospora FSU 10163]|nr:cysteine proteinase [Lichtheimia hyalospora FSU 10163]
MPYYEEHDAPPPYEPPQQTAIPPDQPPPEALSVIDDYERIIDEKLESVQDKVIELKCEHWIVENFDELPDVVYGPTFEVGGHKWYVELHPRGNNNYGVNDYASIYLVWDGPSSKDKGKKAIPSDYACAQFVFCMSTPRYPTNYKSSGTHHRFTTDSNTWGYAQHTMLKDTTTRDPDTNREAYLEDGKKIRVTTIVRVIDDSTGLLWIDDSCFISRDMTGYIGFKHEGTLSYLHSILQLLFSIKSFRRAVYALPTENQEPTSNTALALQRLFYQMQYSDKSVSVLELTRAFGWRDLELYMAHDCVEFIIVLLDLLQRSYFNGTILPDLFESTIRQKNGYAKKEYVFALNTDGCASLDASFVEATKTSFTIESLPSVLFIQLKHWKYNAQTKSLEKIYDPYTYPQELDMGLYLDKKNNASGESHKYVLFSVIMHDGTMSQGVNYVYIKPEMDTENWYKFDGDKVYPAKVQNVLDPRSGLKADKNTAYVLGYIRKSQLSSVLADIQATEIPSHVMVSTLTDALGAHHPFRSRT